MALGAEPRRVMRQVLVGVARFIKTVLVTLVPTDNTMVALAAVALAAAAGVAGYLPARRAARRSDGGVARELVRRCHTPSCVAEMLTSCSARSLSV